MSRISEQSIQEVLERADLVDVIGNHVRLTRAGNRYKGLCPFHQEKTPSFIVSPDRGIWKCFGCGKGGHAITFIQLAEYLDFPDAVKFLADKMGIHLRLEGGDAIDKEANPYEATEFAADYFFRCLMQLKGEHPALAFLKQRRISEEFAKKFRLGYAPDGWDNLIREAKRNNIGVDKLEAAGLVLPRKEGEGFYDRFRHRVIFPIMNVTGRVIAFGARDLGDQGPKYLNSPETSLFSKGRTLYALNMARESLRKNKKAILCEGYMDALALHIAGFTSAVATLGTALTEEHIRLLSRYAEEAYLVFDADAAGQAAAAKAVEVLLAAGMPGRIVAISSGKDPDELIRAEGAGAFELALAESVDCVQFRIRRSIAEHGSSSAAEKSRVARDILPIIRLVRSEVQRAGYLEMLARAIDVDREVLLREIKLLARRSTGPASADSGEKTPQEPASSEFEDPDERLMQIALSDLLRIFQSNEPETRQLVSNGITELLPIEEDNRYDRVFRLLLETSNENLSIAALLLRCDIECQNLITAAAVGDPLPPRIDLAIKQNLETIRSIRIKRRIHNDIKRLQEGKQQESSADHESLEGVMESNRERHGLTFHANEPVGNIP